MKPPSPDSLPLLVAVFNLFNTFSYLTLFSPTPVPSIFLLGFPVDSTVLRYFCEIFAQIHLPTGIYVILNIFVDIFLWSFVTLTLKATFYVRHIALSTKLTNSKKYFQVEHIAWSALIYKCVIMGFTFGQEFRRFSNVYREFSIILHEESSLDTKPFIIRVHLFNSLQTG